MSQITSNSYAVVLPVKKVIPDVGDDVTPNVAGELNLAGGTGAVVSGNNVTHTLTIDIDEASDVQKGIVELATNSETIAGADTTRAVTPDDLKAKLGAQTDNGIAFGATQTAALEWTVAGTDGQVLLGATAAAPAFATLTSTGGTITFTTGANTLNLEAVSSIPAGGVTGETLMAVTGSDPVWDASPTFSGLATAAGLTSSSGDVTVTAGDINLPTTSSTAGVININATKFMHAYGTDNAFLGLGAGNTSLSSANGNCGIGSNCLDALTTGAGNNGIGQNSLSACTEGLHNQAFGYESLASLTTGDNNLAIGRQSLTSLTTGDNNITFGSYQCGINYTSSESSNILIGNTGTVGESNKMRIGTTGSGDGQVNATYIAGIHGISPSGATQTVVIDSDGQLGSTASSGGLIWTEVTATTQAMVADNGYIANNASQVVFTLPSSCAVGKTLRVAGKGAGEWKVEQNSGQTIHFGTSDTTTGTSGYLEATEQYDAIEMICITADTDFVVASSLGNITIV